MNWKIALFDTCSLVAVDRLLCGRHGLSKHLPKRISVLDESLRLEHLSGETAERLRLRTEPVDVPAGDAFIRILQPANFSIAASELERQMFVSAVHHNLPVVTSERELSNALRDSGREAASFVWVLWSLAAGDKITKSQCVKLTSCLLAHGVAPGGVEANWESIEAHSIAGRKKQT